jgi:nitrate/TMAO reductase-like tetraheme cytochrome c subunit
MALFKKIGSFFTPTPEASRWKKLAPYLVIVLFFVAALVAGTYTWEYTNSPDFCGSSCHIHPSEVSSYQQSPHAQVKCVECHIGRAFIGNQITLKIGDFKHVTAMIFSTYEYPLHVKSLRPAPEICEQCHSSDKYSNDTLHEYIHYVPDQENSEFSTYLSMNTGGGTFEEGLGGGVHWHAQNTVLYYPTDKSEQEIPYAKSYDEEAGIWTEYVDVNSDFDPYDVEDEDLMEMDCVTCHNRISHSVNSPNEAVDSAMARDQISTSIPEIKFKAVEALTGDYEGLDQAGMAIDKLESYYREIYPDFYEENSVLIFEAVEEINKIYTDNVFPEQKIDWDTHSDNIGHQEVPGCFRCHDGKHLEISGIPISVECNTCHTLPVQVGPEEQIAILEFNETTQPTKHNSPNWVVLHQYAFDEELDEEYGICSTCHDVTDWDTGNDTSFCSNALCHGGGEDYLDFEVFKTPDLLRNLILNLPHYPNSFELDEEWHARTTPEEERFYMLDVVHDEADYSEFEAIEDGLDCTDCHEGESPIAPASREKCIACHGETEEGWVALTEKFESNPHDGHYGDLLCTTCHKNFGPYRNPCALCHEDIPYVEN